MSDRPGAQPLGPARAVGPTDAAEAAPGRRRLYPGYAVAAVATVATAASGPGQTFVISLINEPLRTAFSLGKLPLATAYTVATVAAAIPLVLTGVLTDRLGPRRMLAVTAGAFGLACVAMSAAQGLLTVFLGFFLLRFCGQGSLYLVSSHATAMWFHRRLGSINGIKAVCVFAVWAFLPQLSLGLIDAFGWRRTYMLFAVAVWVSVIPLALLFVRDRPEDLGLRTDNDPPGAPHGPRAPLPEPEPSFTPRQARRSAAYWLLAAATVLPGLVGTAMLFDMQPILAGRGMTAADAARAISGWSVTMAVMAIPAGVITDRVRPSVVIPFSLAMTALSSAALALAATPVMAVGAMVAMGLGHATGSACAAATIARYFGRLHHGAIRSALTRMAIIGTGLGPIVTAASAEFFGDYRFALWGFVVACLPVGVLTCTLHRPHGPC